MVNVLLDDASRVKLGDLGASRTIEGEEDIAQSRVGTPLYLLGSVASADTKHSVLNIPEKTLFKMFYELAQAMQHLHHKNIIHRDIKREMTELSKKAEQARWALRELDDAFRGFIEVWRGDASAVWSVNSMLLCAPGLVEVLERAGEVVGAFAAAAEKARGTSERAQAVASVVNSPELDEGASATGIFMQLWARWRKSACDHRLAEFQDKFGAANHALAQSIGSLAQLNEGTQAATSAQFVCGACALR